MQRFNHKGQAILEYLILLTLIGLLCIIMITSSVGDSSFGMRYEAGRLFTDWSDLIKRADQWGWAMKRGQSTLEYAILIAIVAAAVIAMGTYVRRAVQANLKMLEQQINWGSAVNIGFIMGLFNSNYKGQYLAEYAVLISVIIAALIAIGVYIRRGLQGRYRDASDLVMRSMIDQIGVGAEVYMYYEPYYFDTMTTTEQRSSRKEQRFLGGREDRELQHEDTRKGEQWIFPYLP